MHEIPLDSPRWATLESRNGRGACIAEGLRLLLAAPEDFAAFFELWPHMCSEGTAWSSAFAAAPYLVRIAAGLPPEKRSDYVYVLGLIEMCNDPDQCPMDLRKAYREALSNALPLLTETLNYHHDSTDTRYLLAACAAMKGHKQLGEALNRLDAGCPHCGEEILTG